MIAPYWTAIPVMLVHYYATHPLLSEYDWGRLRVLMAITWVWSLRLSHNYFRREKLEWGAREDRRFADMRVEHGKSWWWRSLFNVCSQQVFIMGNGFLMYVVQSVGKPVNAWDAVAIVVAMSGGAVAYFFDTQLHDFVSENEWRKEAGKPSMASVILDRGLWYYSRHPNSFGEQLHNLLLLCFIS